LFRTTIKFYPTIKNWNIVDGLPYFLIAYYFVKRL
jgi:hypothetical protein